MSVVGYQSEGASFAVMESPRTGLGAARDPYHVLEGLRPTLRRLVGLAVRAQDAPRSRGCARGQREMQRAIELAAAHALAVGAGRRGGADADLRDQIRSALLRWQLLLLGDGRPARGLRNRPDLCVLCASLVARILAGQVCYETPLILRDLAGHLQWLRQRKDLPPWGEAAWLDAACETALLARETSWLTVARGRVERLLARQTGDGSFENRGLQTAVEHALTVDSLARLYSQTNWPELRDPVRRALAFAARCAWAPRGWLHPRAAIPYYGAEVMAEHLEEARGVAAAGRAAAENLSLDAAPGTLDDLDLALTASSLAMAAAVADSCFDLRAGGAAAGSTAEEAMPHANPHVEAWIDCCRGAALSLRWRQSGEVMEDAVCVLGRGVAWSVCASDERDAGGGSHTRGASVLHGQTELAHAPFSRNVPGNCTRYRGEIRRHVPCIIHEPENHWDLLARWRERPLGWHVREIMFRRDQVAIHDQVRLRRRAAAIVFGAPGAMERADRLVVLGNVKDAELWRVYRAGRLVEIRRNTE